MTCDYGRTYGKVAADQIEGHGQWLSIREDALLPLVEQFFAERIFGPMRLDKLARQLRAHQKATAKAANGTQKRLRDEVADLDRPHRQADRGARTGSRAAAGRQAHREAPREPRKPPKSSSGPSPPPQPILRPSEDPAALLARLPDLADALRNAPTELKRQVFEAFCLQITYDKPNRRIEISATITEAIADALQNAKDLPQEVSSVAQRDIAGAGFEPATFGL